MNSVFDIANWIILNVDRDSEEIITKLKLQKLLYYAQAWSLVLLNRPMFQEEIQAWTHGPVVPVVFEKYKECQYFDLPIPKEIVEIDTETENVLMEVMRVYGIYGAKYLEELTHQERPWQEARVDLSIEARSENIISLEIMKNFYGEMQKNA